MTKQHVITDRAAIDFSDYYSFFVLRNPFSRIASAFLDKFVRTDILPKYAARLMAEYGPQTPQEQWTFSDFIHAIAKAPVDSLNEHWMPQYVHLIDGVNYDFFQVEDIAKSVRLRNIFGDLSQNVREHTLRYRDLDDFAHELPISALKAAFKSEGQVPSWRALCHSDLEAPIRTVFGPDFELIDSVSGGKATRKTALAPAVPVTGPAAAPDLISVVVPVYNVERFVGACMDSLCQQTDRHFEVIVIDDESGDSSIDIVKTYAPRLPALRILRQANRGLGGARNTGINLAKGAFITFVDSDDVVAPNYIAALRRAQVETGADVVSGTFRKIAEDGAPIAGGAKEVPALSPPLEEHEAVLGVFRQSVAWARLYRTSLLIQSGISFPEKIPHEDLFFTYKLLKLAARTTSINDVIYDWRQREGSLGKAITKEYIDVLPELREDTRRFLETHGGSAREFALASRRNIIFVNNFRAKALRVNPDCLDYYQTSLACHADDIMNDVRLFKASGLFQKATPVQQVAGFVKKARSECPEGAAKGARLDFVFFPLRAYHLKDCVPVYRQLRELGYSVQIIGTDAWRDSQDEVSRAAAEADVPLTAFSDFQAQAPRVRCCVAWNDWDPLMRAITEACHKAGTETIGWIEGIQDYHDVDRGRGVQRCPYLRSRHLILPGAFDTRYFQDTGQRLHVGEVVRITQLWHDRLQQPVRQDARSRPRAVINSNFSYGVLEDKRDDWVAHAVESCKAAGYEPVISRHPFDKGTLFPQHTTSQSFYDAIAECDVVIQRFASGILEALAMGIPTIYFNPHGEKTDKFTEPNGAYPICFDRQELTVILRDRRYSFSTEAARSFLVDHCGLSEKSRPAGEKIARILESVALGTVMPAHSFLSEVKPLPEPGRLKALRKIGNEIPPFFGLPVLEYAGQRAAPDRGSIDVPMRIMTPSQDTELQVSDLSTYLLLDPVAMLPQIEPGGAMFEATEAFLRQGGPAAEQLTRVRDWARRRSAA